ncbi:MAG: hypothetical protein ACUVTL_02015 [Thermoproteota archaeon]
MRINIDWSRKETLWNDTSGALSYNCLFSLWKKGFRNGNWKKLSKIEKALYMASLSLAKMRRRLVNSRLILELRGIIGKLRETAGNKLMLRAYQRAMKLYERFSATGLFEWAPQVRSWFNDPSYILWLGLCSPESFSC